ncbi:hypothetical protein EDC01DRAFT_674420 [Geopyxis carbonaria]|nr:hypothetical protein EDC01DRAFT_674420 [Geopyxis carbonaria]
MPAEHPWNVRYAYYFDGLFYNCLRKHNAYEFCDYLGDVPSDVNALQGWIVYKKAELKAKASVPLGPLLHNWASEWGESGRKVCTRWPPEIGRATTRTFVADLDRAVLIVNNCHWYRLEKRPSFAEVSVLGPFDASLCLEMSQRHLLQNPLHISSRQSPATTTCMDGDRQHVQSIDSTLQSYPEERIHVFLARMLQDFCQNWRSSLEQLLPSCRPTDLVFRALAYGLVSLATRKAIDFRPTSGQSRFTPTGVFIRHSANRREGDSPAWEADVPTSTDYLAPGGDVRVILETCLDDDEHLRNTISRLLAQTPPISETTLLFSIYHVVVIHVTPSEDGRLAVTRTDSLPFYSPLAAAPDRSCRKTASLTRGMLMLPRILSPRPMRSIVPHSCLPPEILLMIIKRLPGGYRQWRHVSTWFRAQHEYRLQVLPGMELVPSEKDCFDYVYERGYMWRTNLSCIRYNKHPLNPAFEVLFKHSQKPFNLGYFLNASAIKTCQRPCLKRGS